MPAQPLPTFRARSLFAPLDPGGRAGVVARRLAQAIRLGLLVDGERLPAESDLAAQLGVSPVTLREALAELRELGLVQTRRGRGGGSFVVAPDGHDRTRLERPLRLLSLHELRDIGDHRAAVAGAAARLAAERALPADVRTLREHAARLAAAASVTGLRRADARVHIEIAAAAQSPRLTRAEMDLWSQIGDLVWLPMAGDPAAAAAAACEHESLIDAIERGEPGLARDLAERHVAAETSRLLDLRLGGR
ncbi:MAG: FadR family transcriptional regulator [Actinobacteria bacterium]|nr:FadR family transcriptional regulator [Actinomycetota bacterium]MBO0788157.1 FadR family transcriptional regulator [Actinomycetota bacterium]